MNKKKYIHSLFSLDLRVLVIAAFLIGSGFSFASTASDSKNSGELPNIVIIFTDDQGYADVSFNPHHGPGLHTPNIDRIAREGVIFSQGYITAPMCLPSRAGLLTGRYQQRAGIHWAEAATHEPRLIADYLREAGYYSTALGKWHSTVDIAGDGNPTENGFDEFYGFNHGGRDYFDLSNKWTDFAPMYRNKLRLENETGYLTDRISEEAVDFIQLNSDRPFLLYVPYSAPHTPLQAHVVDVENHHKHTGDPARKILLAMIDYLDRGVGQILTALEEEGLYENTLIFFMTDNGGSVVATRADNTPLRGAKFTLYEGGVRVPFLVSWPAKIAGGREIDTPVSALDVLPTCLAAAGLEVPASADLDGINLLPYLEGKDSPEIPQRDLFWWWETGPYAGGWAVRSGDWKLQQLPGKPKPQLLLYNIAKDPQEKSDFLARRPDIAEDLKMKFDRWSAEVKNDAKR